MKKYIFFVALALLIVGSVVYYFATFDYRNDIASLEVAEYIDTDKLLSIFNEDEQTGNDRFLGRIIVVNGRVSSVSIDGNRPTIVLETSSPVSEVVCELNGELFNEEHNVQVGDYISIKGECTGYLMDIILVNCIITDHHEK